MTGIFINYRRADSADHTQRIFKSLSKHFGAEHIFMDVETIVPGAKFEAEVHAAIKQCDFFLAVIGRSWLTVKNQYGDIRLSDPFDLLRDEIEAALKMGLEIIPILVDEAAMPSVDDLPETIHSLTQFNAIHFRSKGFKPEIDRIIKRIEKTRQARVDKQKEISEALLKITREKNFSLSFGNVFLNPYSISEGILKAYIISFKGDPENFVRIGCHIRPVGTSRPYAPEIYITWKVPENSVQADVIAQDIIDLAKECGHQAYEKMSLSMSPAK